MTFQVIKMEVELCAKVLRYSPSKDILPDVRRTFSLQLLLFISENRASLP